MKKIKWLLILALAFLPRKSYAVDPRTYEIDYTPMYVSTFTGVASSTLTASGVLPKSNMGTDYLIYVSSPGCTASCGAGVQFEVNTTTFVVKNLQTGVFTVSIDSGPWMQIPANTLWGPVPWTIGAYDPTIITSQLMAGATVFVQINFGKDRQQR